MERLSGLDASFLYMETPSMQMHVCFTVLCDPANMPGGFSFQKIVDLIESRALLNKEFRRRLVQVPLDLDHPLWIDDPDFDIVHHVRHVALPQPGTLQELGAMIGRISSSLLDRRYPLWEAWVIEGLADGRFALFVKFHHAAVDGVSGASLIQHLFDLEASEPAHVQLSRPTGERIPPDGALVAAALQRRVTRPAQFIKLLGKSIESFGGVLFGEDQAAALPHERATPYGAPRTHFNHQVGPRRNVAFAKLSLKQIKQLKKAAGVTVNDIVLAVCGGALRRYLQLQNDLPEKSLIAMVPVSVRGGAEVRGSIHNRVSGMWATLATDVADRKQRLRQIHADAVAAKGTLQDIGGDMLEDWAEFGAPGAFNLAVRLYSRMGLSEMAPPVHNTIISNIPGPKTALFFAGAKIDAIYPMGPVMEGVGLNITLLSYGDSMDFGLLVDKDLMPQVWQLAAAIEDEFAALLLDFALAASPSKSKNAALRKSKTPAVETGKTKRKPPSPPLPKRKPQKNKATTAASPARTQIAKSPASGDRRLGFDPLAKLGRTASRGVAKAKRR